MLALLNFLFCYKGACQSALINASSARQILEQTIATMSPGSTGGAIKDFSLAGSIQIAGSSSAGSVRILSRGNDDMRLDIAMQGGGTHSVAFLRGRGLVRDRQGTETRLSSSSRAGTEIAFLPTPGVLSDFLGSAREITMSADETVNGRLAHHLTLSRQYPQAKDPTGLISARSRTEFFIDAETSLILRIRQVVYDTRGKTSSQRELAFSDYRPINGLVLPFSITEISDGQKTWTITVESISLSPELSDTDFQ
jgi:hypothetical protein